MNAPTLRYTAERYNYSKGYQKNEARWRQCEWMPLYVYSLWFLLSTLIIFKLLESKLLQTWLPHTTSDTDILSVLLEFHIISSSAFIGITEMRLGYSDKKTENATSSIKASTSNILFQCMSFPRQFTRNWNENNQIIGKTTIDAIWYSQMGLYCRSCTFLPPPVITERRTQNR